MTAYLISITLTIILTNLKLTNKISWGCFRVLSPIILHFFLVVLTLVLYMTLYVPHGPDVIACLVILVMVILITKNYKTIRKDKIYKKYVDSILNKRLSLFLNLLTLLFIGLKLLNSISWSWFWVLSPTLIPLIVIVIIAIIIVIKREK